MSQQTDNLVLEHLRHIRGRVDSMSLDVVDLKTRISSLEEMQGQVLVLLGAMGKRMDRTDERLARVERRLDLVTA
mgnify:CR=1 FL=1